MLCLGWNVYFSERVIDVQPQHNCSSKAPISLCCIDGHGKLFTVAFWLIDFQFALTECSIRT